MTKQRNAKKNLSKSAKVGSRPRRRTTGEAHTFSCTQDELLFVLRLLDLPDLPGVGIKPWGDTDLQTAQQRFGRAGLALKKRGVVALDRNRQPVVDHAVNSMLAICAYPSQMVAVAHALGAGVPPAQFYYYRDDKHAVSQSIAHRGQHLFEMLSKTDMGYKKSTDFFRGMNWSFVSQVTVIDEALFSQAQKVALINTVEATGVLESAGFAAVLADRLSHTFAGLKSKTMIQWIYQADPKPNQATITLLAGEKSCWMAEAITQDGSRKLKVIAVDTRSLEHVLAAGFGPFLN